MNFGSLSSFHMTCFAQSCIKYISHYNNIQYIRILASRDFYRALGAVNVVRHVCTKICY